MEARSFAKAGNMDAKASNFSQNVEFTITNGQVSAMGAAGAGHGHPLHLPGNAVFTVSGTTVTEVITSSRGLETLQYVQDATNTSLYHLSSDSLSFTTPGATDGKGGTSAYTFTLSDGKVSAVQHVSGTATDSHSHTELLLGTQQYTVSGSNIVETSVRGNAIETTTYVPGSVSGQYVIASQSSTFVQAGTATTLLAVDGHERARFVFGSDNAVTGVQSVALDGTLKTVAPASGTSFAQLAPGYVVESHVNGARNSYQVYHDGNGDGIYTEVAHGSGTTVDLVGLKAQINSVIEGLS